MTTGGTAYLQSITRSMSCNCKAYKLASAELKRRKARVLIKTLTKGARNGSS